MRETRAPCVRISIRPPETKEKNQPSPKNRLPLLGWSLVCILIAQRTTTATNMCNINPNTAQTCVYSTEYIVNGVQFHGKNAHEHQCRYSMESDRRPTAAGRCGSSYTRQRLLSSLREDPAGRVAVVLLMQLECFPLNHPNYLMFRSFPFVLC